MQKAASTSLIDQFRMLSRYNQWANVHLFEACGLLARDEYLKTRKAFFGSIHGTLNHLLLVDRLWLGRVESMDTGINKLDTILYFDYKSLHTARQIEDKKIIQLLDSTQEIQLTNIINYRTTEGTPGSSSLQEILTHLFNHQTHHRGQVHNMLSQTEIAPPPLDLFYFYKTK